MCRIVKLGPQNYGPENLYSYAVVSDGFQLSLFVLARDPQEFRQHYEGEVLNWLQQNGFTEPWNKPLPVYQVRPEERCNINLALLE